MPFQVRPVREFLVRPALPEALARLSDLAYNLLWSWDFHLRSLFRRLDPVLWRSTGHNPILMLGRMPQATLEKAAADPRFVAIYKRACERLDAYLAAGHERGDKLIAYFSMEYGLVECLTIYSGGLGVLSGDHLKGASDLDLPLAGVGLLYQQGYFVQTLSPDGWQQERTPENDFYTLPILPVADAQGADLRVAIDLPSGVVLLKVWKAQVGRISLILLDSNIPQNRPDDRTITSQLYGGDVHMRIKQEIALGIGGLRALKAMGLQPTVFHMNEGHSAFLAIERVRLLMAEHELSFDEALEASRSNNVFTTHTSVPAGIDLFDPGLMHEYFHGYCERHGIGFEQFMSIGRRRADDHSERFSMAIAAIKTSSWRNAVSKLHGEVSREMWQDLWSNLPPGEIPVTSITNGIHLPFWLNGDLALLFEQYLPPDWRDRHHERQTWDAISEIPDNELWEVHRRRKRQLITYVRQCLGYAAAQRKASPSEVRRINETLDPEAFTIGFARRFATYKRATLLFKDIPRLKRLLTNPRMPVQIVIAGKAHPKDQPGKAFIREIVQVARDPEISHRIVFVENYDIGVARELVQGVDLWLNNPKRGEEACGTSGMKAAINGVLNLSILDGWWDECYETSGGWAIGDRGEYSDDQDAIHTSTVLSMLENEIVPLFHEGREEGVPREWMRRVKQSLQNLSPVFNSVRMVDEYRALFYDPAHAAFAKMREHKFEAARDRAAWDRRIHNIWNQVGFVSMDAGPDGPVRSGKPVLVRVTAQLAGLTPSDVKVEAVVGRVGITGQLEHTEVHALEPVDNTGSVYTFAKEFVPRETGRLGYSLRLGSNHFQDPLNRPCNALLKWG